MEMRFARFSDLPGIVSLYETYDGEEVKKFGGGVNRMKVQITIEEMIKNNTLIIAKDNGDVVGFIGGGIYPSGFNGDIFYAALLFYFKPDGRKYVMTFVKNLGKYVRQLGVTQIVMCVPEFDNAEKLARLYRMLGYKKLESHFVRRV